MRFSFATCGAVLCFGFGLVWGQAAIVLLYSKAEGGHETWWLSFAMFFLAAICAGFAARKNDYYNGD